MAHWNGDFITMLAMLMQKESKKQCLKILNGRHASGSTKIQISYFRGKWKLNILVKA